MNQPSIFLCITFALLGTACGTSSSDPAASCAAAAPAACPSTAPAYATDVAPVLQTYCTKCHASGGEQSDKPLTSYAAVKALSTDLEGEVGACSMPPGGETQPTTAERDAILAWIVCGAADD